MNDKIKSLREARHLTQRALGHEIGVSQQVISRIERNTNTITLELLILMSDYFKVSIDYLLGRTEVTRTPENQQTVTKAMLSYYELICMFEVLSKKNQELVWALMEKMMEQKMDQEDAEC